MVRLGFTLVEREDLGKVFVRKAGVDFRVEDVLLLVYTLLREMKTERCSLYSRTVRPLTLVNRVTGLRHTLK